MGSEGAECVTCEPGPHTLPETSCTTALDISMAARPRLARGAQPGGLGAYCGGPAHHTRPASGLSPRFGSGEPAPQGCPAGTSVAAHTPVGTEGSRPAARAASSSPKQPLPPGPLLGPTGLRRPQSLPASVVTATSSQLPHRMPLPRDVENE